MAPSPILMPALSPTMVSGKLARWLVREGDPVRSGDPIAEIETDKATMEVTALDDGVLGRILVADGSDDIAINSVIGMLLGEEEEASALDESAPAAVGIAQPAPAAATPKPAAERTPMGEEAPSDAPMMRITVREALRDAMAEAMRADDDVFVMGEEVAEYEGAYKVTQGC